jgi:hypothetical protein
LTREAPVPALRRNRHGEGHDVQSATHTDSAGLSVRHVAGQRYALIELDPPLRGALAGQWAGQWRLRLQGTDVIQGGTVRYAASVYTRGGWSCLLTRARA